MKENFSVELHTFTTTHMLGALRQPGMLMVDQEGKETNPTLCGFRLFNKG